MPQTNSEKKRLTATIVRDKKTGIYHIRISSKGPQTGGDHVKPIEILCGEDEEEIKERATKFVKSLPD
jgi:hypothetical protein